MEEQKQQQPASKKAIPILAIVISSLVIVGLIGYFGYVLLYPSFAPKFPEKRTCDNARDCRGYCDIPKDQQTGTFTGNEFCLGDYGNQQCTCNAFGNLN